MKHITLPVPEVPIRKWGVLLRDALAWARQTRRRTAWTLAGVAFVVLGAVLLFRPSDSPEAAVHDVIASLKAGDFRAVIDRVDSKSIGILKDLFGAAGLDGVIVSSHRSHSTAVVKFIDLKGREENIPCVLEDGRWRVVLSR